MSEIAGSTHRLAFKFQTKYFFLAHSQRFNIVGSLLDQKVVCSASVHQGSNFKSCVWRAVSFHSSHHLQEDALAQFSLYVHKGGLKSHSFHFIRLKNQHRNNDTNKTFSKRKMYRNHKNNTLSFISSTLSYNDNTLLSTVFYLIMSCAWASQQTQNIWITFAQRRPIVFDVGATFYKCYTNVFCLLGYSLKDNLL